jgi:hypothetical protein
MYYLPEVKETIQHAYIPINQNIVPNVQPFIIHNSLQKISSNFLPPLKLVVSTIAGRHFAQTFFIFTPPIKINRSLSINIQPLCNHSGRKTTIISHQNSYLFDIFVRFSCYRTITAVVEFNFVSSLGNLHHSKTSVLGRTSSLYTCFNISKVSGVFNLHETKISRLPFVQNIHYLFSTSDIQTLFQLMESSSVHAMLDKRSLLMCRVQTCALMI